MKNLKPELEKYRIRGNDFWATGTGDNFGAFLIPTVPGKPPLRVISSPLGQSEWDHVSISLPNRCPTWDEMCRIKNLFWDEQTTVVQFHPPESDYVNNHPYCLHLWKWNGGEIPRPPAGLVGLKGVGPMV